jgi:flagellar biosynthesis protein FlhA
VDLGAQLTRYPRVLAVSATMLAAFGLVPGMPTIPFLAVAAMLGYLAYTTTQAATREEQVRAERELAEVTTEEREPPRAEDMLTIDPLKIELGFGLVPMAEPAHGGDLLKRIQVIRQQTASKMGFIVPVIRIVDNMRLRQNEYRVLLREAEIARYELMPDHFLAMNPGLVEETIEGIPTQEPAFGLQAMWVSRANRDRAERLGYTLVEPSAVLATHLTELILAHADELITREDVQRLVDTIKPTAKTVVDELIPGVLSLGEVQKVLHLLVRERVSIRNLEVVLEVLADYGPRSKDPELLTEYVRHALSRQICAEFKDEDGVLRVVTLSPKLEQEIVKATQQTEGQFIPLDPKRADAIAEATASTIQPMAQSGYDAIVLTSAQVRRFVKRLIERHIPKVVVLSYNEIDPAVRLESEGQIEA